MEHLELEIEKEIINPACKYFFMLCLQNFEFSRETNLLTATFMPLDASPSINAKIGNINWYSPKPSLPKIFSSGIRYIAPIILVMRLHIIKITAPIKNVFFVFCISTNLFA